MFKKQDEQISIFKKRYYITIRLITIILTRQHFIKCFLCIEK